MVGGDSCYLWLAALFLYVTPVFIVAHFSFFHSFIYFLGFLVLKPWLLWIVTTQTSHTEVYLSSALLVCDTVLSLDGCVATFGRNIQNRAPNYTGSLINTPKFSTLCLSGHCTVTFVTLTFRFLRTKYLEKSMIKTDSNVNHFGLFAVSDAT